MNSSVKAQPLPAAPTTGTRLPSPPQPYVIPVLSETQFAAEQAASKNNASSVNGSDVLLLLVAFAAVIGGYMLIRENDRRNNIAHERKVAASRDKPVRGTFPPLDMDLYTDPTIANTTADQNTTAVSKEEPTSSTSKAKEDRHGRLRRLAAAATTTGAPGSSNTDTTIWLGAYCGHHPMGHHPLLCTVGVSDLHNGDMIPTDGLCEYLFFTHYYRSSRDTFTNDSAKKTRAFLTHASRSSNTSFGISVAYRNVVAARRDILKRHGESKLQIYWKRNHVYHYGVLDVEYLSSRGANARQLQFVFDLLKNFKRVQRKLQLRTDPELGRRRGLVVLGVTPWVRAESDVFKELSMHLKSFSIDGLIIRTHLFDSEVMSRFRACLVTPPTSYYKPEGDYLMGMVDALRLYRKRRTPSWHHSLMVSFTMALRWYETANGSHGMGAPCDKKHTAAVLVTDATYACEQTPNLFHSTEVDNHTRAMIAIGAAGKTGTYDDGSTMIRKICALSVDFPDVKTGAAIFDADFQDWSKSCSRRGQNGVKGSRRLRRFRDRYHEIFSSSRSLSGSC